MDILAFEQVPAAARDVVGGKGLALARLAAAGLPVPPGFIVTTVAFRRLRDRGPTEIAVVITDAYRTLGGGPVAVRSSATAEDGTDTSFAGQQNTYLGIDGETAVVEAIERCWASVDNERAKAYRHQHSLGESAMAVVVQRFVAAEVAGVLFTRDPDDATGRTMLVEAAWGLGEVVVAGRVTPDRFRLDRETSEVVERHAGVKTVRVSATGEVPVAAVDQMRFCMTDAQLAALADLGRRVESLDGEPRDIEWAWADGRLWLLQARPITAPDTVERERVRREEMAALAKIAEPGGTVWAKFNLAEVLPAPTPMTWAVVQRLVSASGGLGRMYRDFGFAPDPSLGNTGVYDLIAGRPYCNLSREPRMWFAGQPFGHSFAELKADPAKAMYPTAKFLPERAGIGFYLTLPWTLWRATVASRRMQQYSRTFADRFRADILPAYLSDVATMEATDLTILSMDALIARFDAWCHRVFVEFARDSLKPTALAAHALAELGEAGPTAAFGASANANADLPAALLALANGRLSAAAFLERFGHRGPQEMELSQPRWSETGISKLPSPTGLPGGEGMGVRGEVRERPATVSLRTYLGLREEAKHYLMRGYAQLRHVLLEIDRRCQLNGGIFYLTPEELRPLAAGTDYAAVIAERRRRRNIALSLYVPPVVFSDDLNAVGRLPAPPTGATTLTGVGISAGVAEGPARVLREPTGVPAELGYVLVCPSTDPAWVPLFVGAAALVMETGGVLSHGAIVAREFGLPAVAGIPDATRILTTGRRIRVDGSSGAVTVLPDVPD